MSVLTFLPTIWTFPEPAESVAKFIPESKCKFCGRMYSLLILDGLDKVFAHNLDMY